MDSKHAIMLVLTALITASQFVAGNIPQYAAVAHAVAGVLASLMPLLGALSPQLTMAAPAPGALAEQVKAQTATVAAELAK